MSTAIPQVPPRPTRTHDQGVAAAGTTLGSDLPSIPPRPAHRRMERSISPHRESFARSPLNEAPTSLKRDQSDRKPSSLYSSGSANNSNSDLPRRPPSVSLPSIGQEGSEYGEAFEDVSGPNPELTRSVANDLKLHAPKPSLPVTSAEAQVSAVTRTDSTHAASFGIGKVPADDKDPGSRDLKSKGSFASQASVSMERRPSSAENEHGIPEIGQRVPMYPNAGDVQAPSPSPFAQPFAPGIGFHNDGSKPRHHGRKHSARGNKDLPLEAYGKHGHGVLPHDRFEKAYYEKHPELIKRELEQYHDKSAWALSSDDLNKMVRDTASRGSISGPSYPISTPDEQIGFQAAEEYTHRMNSPHPPSRSGFDGKLSRQESSDGQTAENATQPKLELDRTLSRTLYAPSDVTLSESEFEDEETIHVDPKHHRLQKIYSASADRYNSTESLGEEPLNDEEYSAPILASDEVAKEPFGYDLQPAVSPTHDPRGSHEGLHHFRTESAGSLSNSRPSSRPGSIHGVLPGLRMSAPLEDLEEYEPLFPEDETNANAAKPLTAADRLKRPELRNRKFPSQDIWEDAPNSLNYTATVSTPQLPDSSEDPINRLGNQENASTNKREAVLSAKDVDTESFLSRESGVLAHIAHLQERPGMQHRFPSQDIWEDTPDSLQLRTTVAGPQSAESEEAILPEDRPTTGAVTFHQEKFAAGEALGSEEGRATTGLGAVMKPQVPTRPARSTAGGVPEKQAPTVPDRPSRLRQTDIVSPPLPLKSKPIVPTRPSKPLLREEGISHPPAPGVDEPTSPTSKTKPQVPSRPIGSKIAALQGGFMSDLNRRLQLGPQAPKKEEPAAEEPEPEKEKAPLADARKGRARGPARRAPVKSPSTGLEQIPHKPSPLSFCITATNWSLDPEEDFVTVSSEKVRRTSDLSEEQRKASVTSPIDVKGILSEPVETSQPSEHSEHKEMSPSVATNPQSESTDVADSEDVSYPVKAKVPDTTLGNDEASSIEQDAPGAFLGASEEAATETA